jgi:hypothetical protein
MPLPAEVVMTTVTGGPYLTADEKPDKGLVIFRPGQTAAGNGIVITGNQVRRKLDSEGKFTVDLPTSVDGGTNPDLTYEFNLLLDGGVYTRRIVQIPVTDQIVDVEALVPVTPTLSTDRFVFPAREVRPTSPQPGEAFYNTTTGDTEYWNAGEQTWVPLSLSVGAPPVGVAGGVLSGTYPNPTLAPNSVDSQHLKANSVTADKLTITYVPMGTYTNDLTTTALALGDLQEEIDGKLDASATARVLVLDEGEEVPPGTPAGTVIIRRPA